MRLDDDFDEDYDDLYEVKRSRAANSGSLLKMTGLISVFFCALVIFLMIFVNQDKKTTGQNATVSSNQLSDEAASLALEQAALEKSIDELLSGSTLTADDLDIWDTPEPPQKEVVTVEEEKVPEETEKLDPSEDGLHTLIVYDDGREEWADINQYLTKNDYKPSGFVLKNGLLGYYENNKKISTVGVDISKAYDYVDFNELKKSGIDYVMISLGGRGYASGELYLDDYFEENMTRATQAGLDIGVYFFSSAITLDEAVEEAHFVSENLVPYTIKYPVAYYTEDVKRQESRNDGLDKMTRTNIALAFMETIEEEGYSTILYGTKAWLIKKFSLGSMMKTDVWLSQYGDLPDYPYEFVMWRYSNTGKVSGISGYANLNICFVDYSIK